MPSPLPGIVSWRHRSEDGRSLYQQVSVVRQKRSYQGTCSLSVGWVCHSPKATFTLLFYQGVQVQTFCNNTWIHADTTLANQAHEKCIGWLVTVFVFSSRSMRPKNVAGGITFQRCKMGVNPGLVFNVSAVHERSRCMFSVKQLPHLILHNVYLAWKKSNTERVHNTLLGFVF